VALMQKKEEVESGKFVGKKASKAQELFLKKNKGIEERMKNDLKTEISEKTSQNMLIKKEKIYENLCKQGVNLD